MTSGIYKITNKINGKIYIGQSIDIERRFKEHKSAKTKSYLHQSIRKHGRDNFLFEIQEIIQKENNFFIDEREDYYIRYFDSMNPQKGYNSRLGGRTGSLSENAKTKIGMKNKQRPIDQQGIIGMQKLGICNYDKTKSGMYGKKHTSETKEKMKKSRTDEYKNKMSEIKKNNHPFKGKTLSEEHKIKIKQSWTQRKLKNNT